MAISITSDTRAVRLDRHHVRSGHHDLPNDGVAEVDDGVDEGAFLPLDHVVLDRRVGHGQQLLLGHERPLLDALAGQDEVGDADEGAGDPPDRAES